MTDEKIALVTAIASVVYFEIVTKMIASASQNEPS
jgi:hypothetical protein